MFAFIWCEWEPVVAYMPVVISFFIISVVAGRRCHQTLPGEKVVAFFCEGLGGGRRKGKPSF